MRTLPLLTLLGLAVSTVGGAEPVDATTSSTHHIKTYTGGWGKGAGSSKPPASILDRFGSEVPPQSAELPAQITAMRITQGPVSIEGLAGIEDRLLIVRLTNPNCFPVLFRGRQYKGYVTVKQIWCRVGEGERSEVMGYDTCGTGVRDFIIPATGTMDVLLVRTEELDKYEIRSRFYRESDPTVFSVCLLYDPAGDRAAGSH